MASVWSHAQFLFIKVRVAAWHAIKVFYLYTVMQWAGLSGQGECVPAHCITTHTMNTRETFRNTDRHLKTHNPLYHRHTKMPFQPLPPPSPLHTHNSPSTRGTQPTSGDDCCCLFHSRQVPSALHDSRRPIEGCIASSRTASVCPVRAP